MIRIPSDLVAARVVASITVASADARATSSQDEDAVEVLSRGSLTTE